MPPLVITSANAHQMIEERLARLAPDPRLPTAGCYPRRSRFGSFFFAAPAEQLIEPIPRTRWPELIEQTHNRTLHDLSRDNLPPHDQGNTNYCWAHGSVRTLELVRLYEGQPPLLLSAESVAVPLTHGVNRGGTPDEALARLVAKGACEQTLWPRNDRNEQHASPGWEKNAARHRLYTWLDVRGFDMQLTLAILAIPLAIGLRWWGHLVCQVSPVQLGPDEYGIGFHNSWGPDWGDNGYAVLDEKHATADLGAFAPLSASFLAPEGQ
jgi:hypothetical protein